MSPTTVSNMPNILSTLFAKLNWMHSLVAKGRNLYKEALKSLPEKKSRTEKISRIPSFISSTDTSRDWLVYSSVIDYV